MFIIKEVTPQDVTSFIVLIQTAGSVPKSVSGKNPLKFVNFKCHCKFNVLFLIVL